MGWLLWEKSKTNKPRKGSGKTSSRKGASPRPWDPQRTLATLSVLGTFAALLAAVLAWHYGERSLRHYVSAHHATPITAGHVELTAAPDWMSQLVREELQHLVAEQVSDDPLDRLGLAQAVKALESNPWVSDVHQVQRQPGGRIVVQAAYREPVAVVEASDGYHLVDAEGIMLPGVYFRHQLPLLEFPTIINVQSAPPWEGELWPGHDVQAGLALVKLLARESFADQIGAYDVGQRDAAGRIRLMLHTRENGRVCWGLPPGEERSIEVDAQIKLRWLRQVAQQEGSIDAGGQFVDVRIEPAIRQADMIQTRHAVDQF